MLKLKRWIQKWLAIPSDTINEIKILQQLQQQLQQLEPKSQQLIKDKLKFLTEREREVLSYYMSDEYRTYEEIAEYIKISPVSVRSIVSKIKKKGFPFEKMRYGHKKLLRIKATVTQQLLNS